jgi:hypothetical protein
MASTYSDLKIELIGTGEQVGTWGTTTNANLGTAIEEAIVGSADVAFSSSDVTLTLTNTNSTQAARHLRLNLTGTSGGARNLILGSGCQIDKPYIINNGLADTVTVKNTTGTGIAVPAGKTMWVYNNGTNVVEAMNHAATLTAGTLALTTPLAAASGGTGLSSPGTTGNVLTSNGTAWTSAALPTLGTMASQNANNVAITGGSITGITDLAVADGGTGSSSLAANNVLLGNGTSALQVVAPSTSGNVLTSNGTTWTSTAPSVTSGSFTGANQSLAASGFQKLPGGLIMQWGVTSSISSDSSSTITFPTAFPSACRCVQVTENRGLASIATGHSSVSSVGTTSFVLNNGADASVPYYWFAIGY